MASSNPLRVLFLDIENGDRAVLRAALNEWKHGEYRIWEESLDLADTGELTGYAPDLVFVDITRHGSHWEEVRAVLSVAFAPSTVVVLGEEGLRQRFMRSVFHLCIKAWLAKPLTKEGLEELDPRLLQSRSGEMEALRREMSDPMRNIWQLFRSHWMLTNLFKGTADGEEEHTLRDYFGESGDKALYVFAVQTKATVIDPLPSNFSLFALIDRTIATRHLVVCTAPTQLVGIVQTGIRSWPELRPELRVVDSWLESSLRFPTPLFVSVGIGVGDVGRLRESYQCAMTGLGKIFYLGYRTLGTNPQAFYQERPHPRAKEYMELFGELLDGGDRQAMADWLEEMYRDFRGSGLAYIASIRQVYTQLLYLLTREEDRREGRQRDREEMLFLCWHTVEGMQTLPELQAYLLSRLYGVLASEEREGAKGEDHNRQVAKAKAYLRSHYADPALSLHSLADQIASSPSHLAALFKKETGATVGQYLQNIRIEKSKKLLGEPGHKLADVARAVGFVNPEHFSKTFKKLTGIPPSAFNKGKNS
ncbi:MAG: helix-turn-helix domain-containing protein [Oscillospiraceae bacterium]